MKLLVVSAHYPPNFVSGGTLVPARAAEELARRGHEVRVLAGAIRTGRASGEVFDEPGGDEPGVHEPGGDEPGVHEPGGDEPGGDEPGGDEPGGDEPGGDEPGGDTARVPVRWIVTDDAIDWSTGANFDNPRATEELDALLDTMRPDLVHFHSMQGLGAGLLVRTAERGIPFVVTAHDFWWWCGRQFLCDRDYHPCSPVVVAGVCRCQVDRGWLVRRTAFTTAALAKAGRVIAVSPSEADVMVANGLSPDQVVVIENPVDAEAEPVAPAADSRDWTARRAGGEADGAVRFLYAGGDSPLKGLHVLRRAVHELVSVPGWRLDCYGVTDDSGTIVDGGGTPTRPWPDAAHLHASFAPADLRRVLAHADVLVVPSVMQETYSILTREALAAGLPVVTTACLGPEEVVRDGENGLVVPQDDPHALADAIRRLVSDRGLLSRLRGAAIPVSVMTVTAHCDALEAVYGAVAAPSRSPSAQQHRRPIRRVLFVVGIEGAPLRYRARLPAEALELLGIHTDVLHYRHPDISALGDAADVVVVYRVPASPQVRHFIAGVQRQGVPVLFDVDDLIFEPDLERDIPALKILTGDERALWLEGVHRYRTTMELCDGFIGSTRALLDHAGVVPGLVRHQFANGVGIFMGRLADAALQVPRTPGPLRVGYLSGTDTHDRDWAYVEPAVVDALTRVPDAQLWLGGKVNPTPALAALGTRVRRIPFRPWQQLPALLRDLDVNLAPLEPDTVFNEAKSAIKWLEAALVATPTVASPTAPFEEVVRHGANGLLARTPGQWAEAIETLLADEALRHRLGTRARRDALVDLGPWTQGRRYLEILQSACLRPVRESAWTPVVVDEPFAEVRLEPYSLEEADAAVPAAPAPSAVPPLITLAIRALRSVQRRGVPATAALAVTRAFGRIRRAARRRR